MRNLAVKTFAFTTLLFACGCADNDQKKDADESNKPAGTMQALAENVKKLGSPNSGGPVNFHELEALLSEKLDDFNRIQLKGEKSGAAGFLISTAEARYKGKNNQTIKIEIIDTGGIASASTMTLASWAIAEIDKESASGYEKTTKFKGYKAFEKYDQVSKNSALNVMVAERFLVNAEGKNLSTDQLKSALRAINLSKLNNLK